MNEIKPIITNITCPFCKDISKEERHMIKFGNTLFCLLCRLRVKFDLENLYVEVSHEFPEFGIGVGANFDIEYIDYDFCKKCKQKKIFYIPTFNRTICLNCYSDT